MTCNLVERCFNFSFLLEDVILQTVASMLQKIMLLLLGGKENIDEERFDILMKLQFDPNSLIRMSGYLYSVNNLYCIFFLNNQLPIQHFTISILCQFSHLNNYR